MRGNAPADNDPLLAPFRHSESRNFYSLRGKLYPGSIRDQQLRGSWLMRRLLNAIGDASDLTGDILIIGSGVAGVSAAMAGAQWLRSMPGQTGYKVILVDTELNPFSRQRSAKQRTVEPVGYDWPAAHWSAPKYVVPGCLPMRPQTAAAASSAWHVVFEDFCRQHAEELNYLRGWRAEIPGASSYPFQVTLSACSGRAQAIHVTASLILHCGGFGEESDAFANPGRIPIPPGHSELRSLRFWDDDRLCARDFGLAGKPPRILIAGGGDGALQDFCRAVTGRSAIELLRELGPFLRPSELALVHDWEVQTSRALPFLPGMPADEQAALRALHAAHAAMVREVFADSSRDSLRRRLAALVRPPFRSARAGGRIRVVSPNPFFSRSYPANQFVALLASESIKQSAGIDPFQYQGHVGAAFCNGAGLSTAADCYGADTTVYWTEHGSGRELLFPETFNIVFNRTGIKPGSGLPSVVQLLPYWPPYQRRDDVLPPA